MIVKRNLFVRPRESGVAPIRKSRISAEINLNFLLKVELIDSRWNSLESGASRRWPMTNSYGHLKSLLMTQFLCVRSPPRLSACPTSSANCLLHALSLRPNRNCNLALTATILLFIYKPVLCYCISV